MMLTRDVARAGNVSDGKLRQDGEVRQSATHQTEMFFKLPDI